MFPEKELGHFVEGEASEKIVHVSELSEIITGMRLFSRELQLQMNPAESKIKYFFELKPL